MCGHGVIAFEERPVFQQMGGGERHIFPTDYRNPHRNDTELAAFLRKCCQMPPNFYSYFVLYF